MFVAYRMRNFYFLHQKIDARIATKATTPNLHGGRLPARPRRQTYLPRASARSISLNCCVSLFFLFSGTGYWFP